MEEEDWWEKNHRDLVQKHRDFARVTISGRVDCNSRPQSVEGYSASFGLGDPAVGNAVFATERVDINWSGNFWFWESELYIYDELGTDFDTIPETLITCLIGGILTPHVPVIRAKWPIQDGGCREDE